VNGLPAPRARQLSVDEVVQHLLRNAEWSASRSRGPGGQHRDKASTRAELTLGLDSLIGLEPELVARLAAALGLNDLPLRISIQDERSLSRNHDIAIERLTDLVAQALTPPPPPRRPTRPSRAKREARLADKTRRASLKRLRREPPEE
jgi:ribosome-associated protein